MEKNRLFPTLLCLDGRRDGSFETGRTPYGRMRAERWQHAGKAWSCDVVGMHTQPTSCRVRHVNFAVPLLAHLGSFRNKPCFYGGRESNREYDNTVCPTS